MIPFLFLAGIAAGTAAGVWQREWLAGQVIAGKGILYLQLQKAEIPDRNYLFYILRLRGTELAVLLFCVYSGWYDRALGAVACCFGVWCGLLITTLTFLYGVSAFGIFLAAVFPHFFLYGFGSLLFYEFCGKRVRFRRAEQVRLTVQISMIFAAGILGEAMLQPLLIAQVCR